MSVKFEAWWEREGCKNADDYARRGCFLAWQNGRLCANAELESKIADKNRVIDILCKALTKKILEARGASQSEQAMKLDAINNPCLKHATTKVSGEACVSCMVERIAEFEKENAALKDQQRDFPRVCHWSEDDDGIWNGTCGIAWCFEYATTPQENKMNYCPQCGAVLMENNHRGV